MKRKFQTNEIAPIAYGGACNGYVWVEKTFAFTKRWSIEYNLVFTYGGKTWRVLWGEAPTEMQEGPMWDDEVEATEVVAAKVMVTKWVPIEREG